MFQRPYIFIFILEGDAFMVGDGTYLTYLYPDLTSSMYGKADEKGHMINGRYGRVHQFKVHKLGLPIPKVRLLFIILHLYIIMFAVFIRKYSVLAACNLFFF